MSPRLLDQWILKPRFLFFMSTSVGCPVPPSRIPLTKIATIQLIYSSPLFALPPTPLPQPWNSLHCSVGCGSWAERKQFQVGSPSHTDTSGPCEARADPSNRLGREALAQLLSFTRPPKHLTRVDTRPPLSQPWETQRMLTKRAALSRLPETNPLRIPNWCSSYPQRKRIFKNCETGVPMFPLKKTSPFWSFSRLILASAL